MYPSLQDQPGYPYTPPDPATIVESQPPRDSRPRLPRLRPRAFGPVVFALLLGVVATFALTTLARANTPWPAWQSPTAHAVRVASPAVVRIITVEMGKVTCPGCGGNGQDLTLPANGSGYPVLSSGSGALISSDGVILTADHVVDVTPNDSGYILADAAQDLSKATGVSLTDAQNTLQALQQSGRLQVSITVTQRTAFLSADYAGSRPDDSTTTRRPQTYDITQVLARSPMTEHDIAIVKINAHDLPSLPLAPAGATHAQDPVTAIGFPADADVGAGLYDSADWTGLLDPTHLKAHQLDSLLTPTIEDGQITAEKWLADGTPIFEATGIGNHGSSGGPVIDAQGRIVGFMDRLGNDVSSTRVLELMPTDTIASFAQRAHISLGAPGAFMDQWQSAMNTYDADGYCHWTDARDTLSQLQARYPQFGAVQSYLAAASAQAANTHCVSLSGFASANGARLTDFAHQVARTVRNLGRTIGRLNDAVGLALPVVLILLGLLIGLGLLAQPQLLKLTARGGQPQPGAGDWMRAWARQTPWWGVAIQAIVLGAIEGFVAWAALSILRLTTDGPLGLVVSVTAGTLAAGLVMWALLRRYDRAYPASPPLPPSQPPAWPIGPA